jgi:hypothetical protein
MYAKLGTSMTARRALVLVMRADPSSCNLASIMVFVDSAFSM